MKEESDIKSPQADPMLPKIVRTIAGLIVLGGLVVGISLIAKRSTALTQVLVKALDADKEPKDLGIPFLKKGDVLPDYKVTLITTNRWKKIYLGAKPNTSAVDGLVWKLPDPISTADLASVRLDDEDKVISDAIAEVQVDKAVVILGNYRFEFTTELSASVGIRSFLGTSLGQAIMYAVLISVIAIFASVILPA